MSSTADWSSTLGHFAQFGIVYKSQLKLALLGNRKEKRIWLYGTATLGKTPLGLIPTSEIEDY